MEWIRIIKQNKSEHFSSPLFSWFFFIIEIMKGNERYKNDMIYLYPCGS